MKYLNILLILLTTSQVLSNDLVIPKSSEIIFEITRKNKVIGKHIISFEKNDDIINVNVIVDINVKIGFLSLYKYKHENKEQWKNNQLYKISTNSITNSKKKYKIIGNVKNDNFEFIGVDNKKVANKNIIPISYWNKEIIKRNEFLDTQKGIIRKFEIEFLGNEEIVVNNNKVSSDKYKILVLTKHPTDEKPLPLFFLWYTKVGELAKLEFNSPEDNSVIIYNRVK